MNKLRFIFKRLKSFNFKAMFSTAKKISKKTHRLFIVVLIDIVYCGFKYQAGYNDYLEFEFYLLNKKQRMTYLTAGKNNEIVRKYNNKEYWHLLDDKIEFNEMFNEYLKRDWLDLRKTSIEKFEEFISKHEVIIVKPIDDCGGNGVEKIDTKAFNSLQELYDKLKEEGKLLVEECIIQHEEMNKLYSNSVNTLRLFTINKNGETACIQYILKIGNGSFIDNFSSGGMYTFLNEQGIVIAPAIDKYDNVFEKHPISNKKIVGFKVPYFNEAIKMVCDAAKEINQVGYIGWDVAITKNGPAILEGNCFPGVFQLRPSFSKDKIGILHKYSKFI